MFPKKLFRFVKRRFELKKYHYYYKRSKPIPFSYRGRRYFLNPEKSAIYHIEHSTQKMQNLVDSIAYPPQRVFDVGANCGIFSAFVKQKFPNATIHAFEPSPELTPLIAKNCEDAIIEASAVGEFNGETTLYLNEESQQTNSLSLDAVNIVGNCNRVREIQVKLISIDHYCAERNIHSIDVLKIDIQGLEGSALRGARRMLPNTGQLLLESTWMDISSIQNILPFAKHHGFLYIGVLNSVFLGADILLSRTSFSSDLKLITQFELGTKSTEDLWI